MRYLKQFLIIIGVSLLGELLHFLIPIPIPGSIYGIVLMFAFLQLGILKLADVEETGLFLVEIMPVMFVPVCVGLLDSWDIIKASWLKYAVLIVVSTIVVMVVSGRITQFVIRKQKGSGDASHQEIVSEENVSEQNVSEQNADAGPELTEMSDVQEGGRS